MDKMFCYQCQETAKGQGCVIQGVCGKKPETSARMDQLLYAVRGLAIINCEMRTKGNPAPEVSKREDYGRLDVVEHGGTLAEEPFSVLNEKNPDIRGLKQLAMYGCKGMAAYARHAYNLGYEDQDVYAVIEEALAEIYSLVVIANALKDAFGVKHISDLPIVFNIAWYEQKAVIVLLALLALGVKGIHTGPTLPAFFTPDILKVLQERFDIGTITTVDNDMKIFGI